jgi:DnaJ-class molecular chaperone
MLAHYQMFDVNLSVDILAFKKAYYSISLLCHPDKTVQLPVGERAQREQLFKFVNIAFEVLPDPRKRKFYDQTVRLGQDRPSTQARNTTTRHPHSPAPGQQPQPQPRTAQPEDAQSFENTSSPQRAPSSSHRFTASTLGKAPDFHWCHCQLSEYSKATTLTCNH